MIEKNEVVHAVDLPPCCDLIRDVCSHPLRILRAHDDVIE